MSNYVSMSYVMHGLDIDRSAEFLNRIIKARDTVSERYRDTINLNVTPATAEGSRYSVKIEARDGAYLDDAVRTFMKLAGDPVFVAKGSDYDTVARILDERGKMLVGRLDIFAILLDNLDKILLDKNELYYGTSGREVTDRRPLTLKERLLEYRNLV